VKFWFEIRTDTNVALNDTGYKPCEPWKIPRFSNEQEERWRYLCLEPLAVLMVPTI